MATLLTDAFNQAIIYWRANNVGTRAGLIAHLQATVGISAGTAGNWVDAIIREMYDLGISDDVTYAAFKTRMQAVGFTRGQAGATCAFEHLRKGNLVLDERDEKVAMIDEVIAGLDAQIASTNTTIASVTATAPGEVRTTSLAALALYLVRLNKMRDQRLEERARLVAQG